jgi:hypothetical protein
MIHLYLFISPEYRDDSRRFLIDKLNELSKHDRCGSVEFFRVSFDGFSPCSSLLFPRVVLRAHRIVIYVRSFFGGMDVWSRNRGLHNVHIAQRGLTKLRR